MKKKTAVVLILCLLAGLFGAIGCGEKSAERIVKKKTEAETGTAAEEAESTKAAEITAAEAGEVETGKTEEPEETEKQKALRESLGVPETYTYTDGAYAVDARVLVPDGDAFVKVSAEQFVFDKEAVQKYAVPLLGEDGLWQWSNDRIDDAEQQLAHQEQILARGEYDDDEVLRNAVEEQNESLRNWIEAEKKTAEKIEVPMELAKLEKEEGVYFDGINGFTEWPERCMEFLLAKYGFSFFPYVYIKTDSFTMSEEEAKTLADSFVEKMGLSGELACDYVSLLRNTDDPENWYMDADCRFYYTRTVNGIPVTYDLNSTDGAALKVIVDNQGVSGLTYGDLVIGNDKEAVTLLPFAEIQSVMEEELSGITYNGREVTEASIEEIRLGYHWVVTEAVTPESSAKGYLVPAWDAFGTVTYINEEGEEVTVGGADMPYIHASLLSVSAVDGAVLTK